MARFPDPPHDLVHKTPIIHILPIGTELWRVYFREGTHPLEWDEFRAYGPVDSRFDHHRPPPSLQDRKILYTATNGTTCLAEVFQKTGVIDRRRNCPYLVSYKLIEEVKLLDLTGNWPTQAGASMAINSGSRKQARKWSLAIYETFKEVQGLLYSSSMNANKPAIALYERAENAFDDLPSTHRALSDKAIKYLVRNAARTLGYKIT